MEQIRLIGARKVGDGQPVYIIGEIGLNHNGDVALAKKLIDTALLAVPPVRALMHQWRIVRGTYEGWSGPPPRPAEGTAGGRGESR